MIPSPGLNIQDQDYVRQIMENWRLTPATLARKLSGGAWISAPWLAHSAVRIASGIMRGGARIIISAPPRHGKSKLVDVWTPVWFFENCPGKNIILASYGAELSEGFGREVRDIIRERGNIEGILNARLSPDSTASGLFTTTAQGYMASVGLGGAITGRGAHVLLIDDFVKEIKEALSPAHRDYVWNWFVTVAMTRLEPGASVVIIATRWHSDDLIGRIIKNFPGQWEHINFPAEAEVAGPPGSTDLIERVHGQALFPQRYNEAYLQGQRALLGSIFYNALYQQRPVDEDHKFTQAGWLKLAPQIPAAAVDARWVRIWDLAATEGGGDYTVGTLLGHSRTSNITCIANVLRKQMSPGQTDLLLRQTAQVDGLDTEILVEQEPGSSGKALVHHIKTTVLPEYRVTSVPATKSKLIRAQPFLAAAENGKVYLLNEEVVHGDYEECGWQEHFIREFELFPNGEYDDQIDTAAAGYNFLSGNKPMSVSFGRISDQEARIRNAARAGSTTRKRNLRKSRKASFMLGTANRVTARVTWGR